MRNLLILAATMVIGMGAMGASPDIEFKLEPSSPFVMDTNLNLTKDKNGDGKIDPDETIVIKAPWIMVVPAVFNHLNETLTVSSIELEFTNSKSGTKKMIVLDPHFHGREVMGVVGPNQSLMLNSWFAEELPGVLGEHNYEVTATLHGWLGELDSSDQRIVKKYQFQTQ